ncbi:hypothetical protein HPB48_018650 [Haemaphysalis longicornis]|uniref:Uncharacterized protein n=1 Tax=Haemaphysalis longicornis TaxID=44386 RepID=A0A9J6GFZ1_HAELO|nr:hypothetical protein HPB48_018650 [Haemaphysalis longicornis]
MPRPSPTEPPASSPVTSAGAVAFAHLVADSSSPLSQTLVGRAGFRPRVRSSESSRSFRSRAGFTLGSSPTAPLVVRGPGLTGGMPKAFLVRKARSHWRPAPTATSPASVTPPPSPDQAPQALVVSRCPPFQGNLVIGEFAFPRRSSGDVSGQ